MKKYILNKVAEFLGLQNEIKCYEKIKKPDILEQKNEVILNELNKLSNLIVEHCIIKEDYKNEQIKTSYDVYRIISPYPIVTEIKWNDIKIIMWYKFTENYIEKIFVYVDKYRVCEMNEYGNIKFIDENITPEFISECIKKFQKILSIDIENAKNKEYQKSIDIQNATKRLNELLEKEVKNDRKQNG